MGEPHDSLLAFLSDLHGQADAFQATNDDPLVGLIMDDLRVRLVAQGVVVRVDARSKDQVS